MMMTETTDNVSKARVESRLCSQIFCYLPDEWREDQIVNRFLPLSLAEILLADG